MLLPAARSRKGNVTKCKTCNDERDANMALDVELY